jgi:hypothetical protein
MVEASTTVTFVAKVDPKIQVGSKAFINKGLLSLISTTVLPNELPRDGFVESE